MFPDRIQLKDFGYKAWHLVWSNWEGIYHEEFSWVNNLEQRLFKIMCTEHPDDTGFTLIGMYFGYSYEIKGEYYGIAE
jgi:hypothetical protein